MDDRMTVWCGNLSEKVTEEILYELFLQAGPLARVNIPKDKYGKQRAFGFITFKHECSVPYSLSLFKGTSLYKRPLNLQSRAHNTNTDNVQQSFGMSNVGAGDKPLRLQSRAHNANADNVQQPFGISNLGAGDRQRTQSLPINFGSTTPVSQDFNMLLQLGQQMLLPGIVGGYSPFYSPGGMYASQMNSSQVLGGQFHDMRTPKSSRERFLSNQNHPYNRSGGSGGGDHNHNSNGRHNKSNANNSRHRYDEPRSSDKRRR